MSQSEDTTGRPEIGNLTIEGSLKRLSASAAGLSSAEASERLRRYGYNEIVEKKAGTLKKLLSYFWGPIPWMIETAAVLSAIVQDWADFFLISALLLVNALVGFWQEHKADNAIELLKRKLALTALVLRDGEWRELPARELVPGDIIRVRLGDIIPADAKLIEDKYLMVDESAITGESLPVEKHAGDLVYAGSVAHLGEVNSLVYGTGENSYFGKTASLVAETRTRSHFQKAVMRISDYLITVAAVLVTVVFLVSMVRHESLLETLRFTLVLTVASIPVALPAVLSVTMAVGAMALARKEAIVSRLAVIEEMAGVDVLCSDKTGTITENILTLGDIASLGSLSEQEVLGLAGLASRAENPDPIDRAIVAAATPPPVEVVDFQPFDPVSKRSEATVRDSSGRTFQVTKGAPQVILDLVPDSGVIADEINDIVNRFAARGYRALGVARRDTGGEWQYAGLLSLYDPPRDDSTATIKASRSLGIRVKMITGDNIAIAREIARQVNMESDIRSAGAILEKADEEAREIVERADGFAEVFPEHKHRIVDLLQSADHIVGMTGDGVNDAPALKKADAGIAVAGATDAAKSAADIVFTRPGLSVIVDAIKESRRIFNRMNSYAIYRVAETMRVLLFISLSILVFNHYPVTAIMIVLIALLNDAPIMMIAYDNTSISRKPERWNMRSVLAIASLLGVLGVISSFVLLVLGKKVLHLEAGTLQTFIFLKLMVSGHMTIYLARTGWRPFWKRPFPAARLFWTTEATQVMATLFAVYGVFMDPVGWKLAGIVWLYSLVVSLGLIDIIKVQFFRLLQGYMRLMTPDGDGIPSAPDSQGST